MLNPITYSISLNLPRRDTRIYQKAAALLVKTMGAKAPSAEQLLLHELQGRTPELIAEEYLWSIGWYEKNEAPMTQKERRRLMRKLEDMRARRLGGRRAVLPVPARA